MLKVCELPRKALQNSVRLVPWRLRAVIKRIPLVAELQRWIVQRTFEGREFVHVVDAGPAKGLRSIVVLPDDKGIWTGTYELSFVSALTGTIRPGDVCFDVGGWRGYVGGAMAIAGAAQVVIFEPLPANCDRIRALQRLNPRLPIRLVQAAVAEADSQTRFAVMPATSMGKLCDAPFQAGVCGKESITVDVVSLDSWLERSNSPLPQVVKVDVEGAELMVLKGARRMLQQSRPTWFIEAHSHTLAAEVVEILEPLGYDVRTLETDKRPDGASEPEVCHIAARPHAQPT